MINTNKMSILDECVDGNLENFRTLINPMYDQFDVFYKSYKKMFDNSEESVKSITFRAGEQNVAEFEITTDGLMIQEPQLEKMINVAMDDTTCKFTVQPYKDENPYYLDLV